MENRNEGSNPFGQHFYQEQQNLLRQQMSYMSSQSVLPNQSQISPQMFPTRRPSYNPSLDVNESSMSNNHQRNSLLQTVLTPTDPPVENSWAMTYSAGAESMNNFVYPGAGIPHSHWMQETNPLLSPQHRDSRLFSSHYQQYGAMHAIQQHRQAQMKMELQQEQEARIQHERLQRESLMQRNVQRRAQLHMETIAQESLRQQSVSQIPYSPRVVGFESEALTPSREINKESLGLDSYIYQSSQQVLGQRTIPVSMPDLSKQNVNNPTLIHFPESSNVPALSMSQSYQWQSAKSNMDSSYIKNIDSPPLLQTLHNNQFQAIKHMEEIDMTIDQHISALRMDQQTLDSKNDNQHTESPNTIFKFDDILTEQAGEVNRSSILSTHSSLGNPYTSQDAVISFTPYLNSQPATTTDKRNVHQKMKSASENQQKNQNAPIADQSPSLLLSQSNTVQATQNSAVNINININMPNHTAFPFNFSQSSESDVVAKPQSTKSPENLSRMHEEDEVCFKIETSTPSTKYPNIKSISTDDVSKQKSPATQITPKDSGSGFAFSPSKKSKVQFSSIECLLGMSSNTNTKCHSNDLCTVNASSLELARTALEHKDRISVIKPLPVISEGSESASTHPSLKFTSIDSPLLSPVLMSNKFIEAKHHSSAVLMKPHDSHMNSTPHFDMTPNSFRRGLKPTCYPGPGGKPANYTFSLSSENKKVTGKPLSYLQSINELNKSDTNIDSGQLPNYFNSTTNVITSTAKISNALMSGGKPYSQLQDLKAEKVGSNLSDSSSSGDDSDESVMSLDEDDMSHSSFNTSQEFEAAKWKRKAVEDPEIAGVIAGLKKRKLLDESLIQIPLQSGWRRQTRLRLTNNGEGIRGDVYYYSPCGKKLRTYPEINVYLIKNQVTNVTLENFSFSMKLKVGDFLEAKEGTKFECLTSDEVMARFEGMFAKARVTKARMEEKKEKRKVQKEKSKKLQEERLRKKLEKEMLKKLKEEQKKNAIKEKADQARLKKQQQAENVKEARRLKAQSLMNEKQRAKDKKEQARLQKLEKQRLNKERKIQVMEEVKHQRKGGEPLSRHDDITMKAKIREMRRQQLVVSKAEEKEKRRRELVMMKAYETQRRAEERERIKEHKRLEKTLLRQRKLEQQRYGRLLTRELKKPIDDMSLKDLRPLPDYPPLASLHIPGQAYADILMVYEFVKTFGHVIDIDCDNDFPSMAELQMALLCESTNEDPLFVVCQSLLIFAIFDPGVSGKYATSALGVNLKNIELTESNISEVLRLFILSRNEGCPHELSNVLTDKPLISLSAVQKASILAFLCNELLCGKAISREIENSLESMSSLRRDKWNLEGEMRRMKADLVKMKPKDALKVPSEKKSKKSVDDDDDKESEDEKESDEEEFHGGSQLDDDTTEAESEIKDPASIEDVEKKVKQMERKHSRCRSKLMTASHTIRGIHLGLDRFKRRYFVLPNAGGVYVEGMESGHFEENCHKIYEQTTADLQDVKVEEEGNVESIHSTSETPCKVTCWFSLSEKAICEAQNKTTRCIETKEKIKPIIAPSVKQLVNDKNFLESIYGSNFDSKSATNLSTLVNSSALLGLPPGLDMNILIETDPQKAAELLEIQTAIPREIPKEMMVGWWRITDVDQLHCLVRAANLRGMRERSLQKSITRHLEHVTRSCKINNPLFSLVLPEDIEQCKESLKSPVELVSDSWFPQLAYASDKAVLMEVEELEEKVYSASLQVKGWHLLQKVSSTLQYREDAHHHPLQIAISRLHALEEGLERRYLKHPFRLEKLTNKNETEDNLVSSNAHPTTPALSLWRGSVSEAKSCAQLSMCISMLNECIAWEKSIMKVFCILCRKSDNEGSLLLCDACDRGCHMYCCTPKLETIPEGDWFCQECILMASGSEQCYACKSKGARRLKCTFCPRFFHMQCLEPPLHKTPRTPWSCPVCKKERLKSKLPRKRPRIEHLVKEEEQKNKVPLKHHPPTKDTELCKRMLTELEQHQLAWPFLVPVNNKQFPEYYKLIKHPMDFQTMDSKLRDCHYKSRDDFARDARLVFKNCNTFNEDFSEVGKAGKTMSKFFEKRWLDMCNPSKQVTVTPKDKVTVEKIDTSADEASSGISSSESESSEIEEDSDVE